MIINGALAHKVYPTHSAGVNNKLNVVFTLFPFAISCLDNIFVRRCECLVSNAKSIRKDPINVAKTFAIVPLRMASLLLIKMHTKDSVTVLRISIFCRCSIFACDDECKCWGRTTTTYLFRSFIDWRSTHRFLLQSWVFFMFPWTMVASIWMTRNWRNRWSIRIAIHHTNRSFGLLNSISRVCRTFALPVLGLG